LTIPVAVVPAEDESTLAFWREVDIPPVRYGAFGRSGCRFTSRKRVQSNGWSFASDSIGSEKALASPSDAAIPWSI